MSGYQYGQTKPAQSVTLVDFVSQANSLAAKRLREQTAAMVAAVDAKVAAAQADYEQEARAFQAPLEKYLAETKRVHEGKLESLREESRRLAAKRSEVKAETAACLARIEVERQQLENAERELEVARIEAQALRERLAVAEAEKRRVMDLRRAAVGIVPDPDGMRHRLELERELREYTRRKRSVA